MTDAKVILWDREIGIENDRIQKIQSTHRLSLPKA